MNTKKKRFVPKKRLIYRRFLALTLAGSLLLPGLVLIQSEPVEANIIVDMASGVIGRMRYNATVAELIVSLLTGSGASVTNADWLSKLNFYYGVESTIGTATGTDGTLGAMYEAGLFDVDSAGHFIDQGLGDAIRNSTGYETLGIDELFTTTNADLEMGAWQVADGATNIGEAAASGITIGTIGQAFGAVSLGVHLGVLANKVVNHFAAKMAAGQYMDSKKDIPIGYKMASVEWKKSGDINGFNVIVPYNWPCFITNPNLNNITGFGTKNISGSSGTIQVNNIRYGDNYTNQNVGNNGTWWGTGNMDGYQFRYSGFEYVNTGNTSIKDYLTYHTFNGNYSPYSPDIIGPSGNQRPQSYTQDITSPTNWPDLKPNENLQDDNTGIKPIPWNDYMDQVTVFNDNTTNNNTTIQQGNTYNNFVTQYITTPAEIPDDTTVESPNYNPTVPEQPIPNPKEELTSEVVQDNTDYMTTPGLKDVFPFSIPWDIAGLFNVFSTNNREAPVITFPLVSELFGIDEEITIDLSPYDGVAALLRLLELIAFGLGLAFVTRYLIGAGG